MAPGNLLVRYNEVDPKWMNVFYRQLHEAGFELLTGHPELDEPLPDFTIFVIQEREQAWMRRDLRELQIGGLADNRVGVILFTEEHGPSDDMGFRWSLVRDLSMPTRESFTKMLSELGLKPSDIQLISNPKMPTLPIGGRRESLLNRIFDDFRDEKIVLLLAQRFFLPVNDFFLNPFIDLIRQKAASQYERFAQYSVETTPPRSDDSDLFYRGLAEDWGFERVRDKASFRQELVRLSESHGVFLLVKDFERATGSDSSGNLSEDFANFLRSLAEECSGRFKALVCGSYGLARQKFELKELSALYNCRSHQWPEIEALDIVRWADTVGFSQLAELDKAGDFCGDIYIDLHGGHPVLIQKLLREIRRYNHNGSDMWDIRRHLESLKQEPFFSRDFFEKFTELERKRICTLAQGAQKLPYGDQTPWCDDRILNELFWENLVTVRNDHYCWRCEWLQDASIRQLGCTP